MPTTLRYVHVDVFTDTPLTGNQLAVFTDARELDASTMQALAKEIGFSETTFVLPAESGGTARVRIFTPAAELPFAGHPTLGTAWVLASPLQLPVVQLETGSGIIPVEIERDESGASVFGRMVQPTPAFGPYPEEERLLAALGVETSELPVESYDNGPVFTAVTLDSPDAVASIRPDLATLEDLGVNVSCVAGSGAAWKTRMFAPALGVGEDPATGAAAGPLACHLCRHGLVEWGEWIEISQGIEIDRPSTLFARADGSADGIERVQVGGRVVVVARGEFRL
jgi:trans-2,3-dihydro-3-hydroxyanthranilate isomerase